MLGAAQDRIKRIRGHQHLILLNEKLGLLSVLPAYAANCSDHTTPDPTSAADQLIKKPLLELIAVIKRARSKALSLYSGIFT